MEWKLAVRSLRRRPAFALTVLGLLAFGLGVTTALFTVVDAVLVKPLPFPRAWELVVLYEASAAKSQREGLIAPARLEDWNRENRTFTAMAGAFTENVTD